MNSFLTSIRMMMIWSFISIQTKTTIFNIVKNLMTQENKYNEENGFRTIGLV